MRPTQRTRALFTGHCERCTAQFNGQNAMGLAAQHAERTTHNVYVERTVIYTWKPLESTSTVTVELANQGELPLTANSYSNGHVGAV